MHVWRSLHVTTLEMAVLEIGIKILDSLVMMCKIENEKGAITKETDSPPLRQTGHP